MDLNYRIFPKYWDTQKICCNHSKIWTMWLYHMVISPNDADRMAKSVDPDQTLIWVRTVCPGISVRKLRIITVTRMHTGQNCAGSLEDQEWFCWHQLLIRHSSLVTMIGNCNQTLSGAFPIKYHCAGNRHCDSESPKNILFINNSPVCTTSVIFSF